MSERGATTRGRWPAMLTGCEGETCFVLRLRGKPADRPADRTRNSHTTEKTDA